MSQAADGGTMLLKSLEFFLQITKMVIDGYQNKTLKEELKEEKKNGKTAKAKACGAMREATNEFLEQNFKGKYETYKDPDTGTEKRIFRAETDAAGMPIPKDGEKMKLLVSNLVNEALEESKGDIGKFKEKFGQKSKEFINGQMTDMFRNQLKDSKDPELKEYASSIQSDATIQNLFDAVTKKAEKLHKQEGSLKNVKAEHLLNEFKNR